MPYKEYHKLYNYTSINYFNPDHSYQFQTEEQAKNLFIKVSGDGLKDLYVTMSQKDVRHEGKTGWSSYT